MQSNVQMCVPLVVAFCAPQRQLWNDKVSETARRQGVHHYSTATVCVFVFEPIIVTGTLCVHIKNHFGLDLSH